MKVNLYLDDLRDCPEGFDIARTVEEALEIFAAKNIEILSLDHDLGSDETGELLPNGYDFVKLFCQKGLHANKIYIHTDNPVGRENMYQLLHASLRRGFIADDIEIYRYPIVPNRYTPR